MEEAKQTRTTYSKDIKYKAVMIYKQGEMGYKAIAKKLGVSSHQTIRRWVSHYEKQGPEGLEEQRGKASKGRPKTMSLSPEEELKRLRIEVELLKKIQAFAKEVKRRREIQFAYRVIQELSVKHSVSILCKIARVSRSGYYKWVQRQSHQTNQQKRDEEIKKLILECYREVQGTYGYYRVRAWLRKKYGLKINHKRVYRLMEELGIQAKIRKKRRCYGTQSEHLTAPNLLDRNFKASRPNEKWATDVTYLQFNNQTIYLSAIYDMFNNEVVAFKISERNGLDFVLETVRAAYKKRDVTGVLLHSDQGLQYTSRQYKKLLKKYHITQSMSRKGNCLDNACIENFFGHLKSELMYLNRFRTKTEVAEAVQKYIRFYNEERIQRKLNDLSPVEYRTKVVA